MKRTHMRVEVVYALADTQDVVVLVLPEGTVARNAVSSSGMLARHRLSAAQLQLGRSGKKLPPESPLHEGDRVEILRPLAAEPNEARRQRARHRRR